MRRFLSRQTAVACRGAFSLVEMMVAIAVMIVALAVVTNVFSISSKTAATSQAISEVEAAIQRYFAELDADLRGIDSTRSLLVMQGRKQVAARTEELRQAGRRWRPLVGDPGRVNSRYNPETDATVESAYPTNAQRDQFSDPRADILMFFTNNARPSRHPSGAALPNAGPNDLLAFQRTLQRGANASLVQVVYGHASFATPTANGNLFNWPGAPLIRHIETADAGESPATTISEIPLNKWTLAARRTLVEDVSTGVATFSGLSTNLYPVFKDRYDQNETGNPSNFRGTWDRITRGWSAPTEDYAGDSAALRFRDLLTFMAPRENTSGALAGLGEPLGLALANPYGVEGWTQNFNGATRQLINNLMYHPDPRSQQHHHVATLSDVAAPGLASNLAMAALPGCAWFQIEFLMPEDPRNSHVSPIGSQRDDMPRWCEIVPGQTYIFVPDSVENREAIAAQVDATGRPLQPGIAAGGWPRLNTFGQVIPYQTNEGNWTTNALTMDRSNNRKIRTWPYAIRITVRVFDTGGKLTEPLTRTFIHRFDM